MLIAVKIVVLGVTITFFLVLFVLLDALDDLYASRRMEDRPYTDTDTFNRSLRKFILYCMLPFSGFAMCAACLSLVAEIFGL